MAEIWLGTFPIPGRAEALAEMAERDGWDGIAFTDSQNLSGDAFVALGVAAHATSRLKLATGTTNSSTRHPAVVASGKAAVQVESGGRAVLGIARGDSALAYLGRKPMPLPEFRRGLEQIQAYLRGESADLDGIPSRIAWMDEASAPKVPISVAATGPRVIELAAQVAERITFSVGADPGRLRAGIETARRAPRPADLPPLSLGAYVNAVAHSDVDRARERVRGRMGVYARFSTMDRRVFESLAEADRAVGERLAATYDMGAHATSGARHEEVLDDALVDRFGVVGPPERVAERLRGLAALGLDHFVIVGHGRDVSPVVLAESSRRFGQVVILLVKSV